jgi:hypothetical protein
MAPVDGADDQRDEQPAQRDRRRECVDVRLIQIAHVRAHPDVVKRQAERDPPLHLFVRRVERHREVEIVLQRPGVERAQPRAIGTPHPLVGQDCPRGRRALDRAARCLSACPSPSWVQSRSTR